MSSLLLLLLASALAVNQDKLQKSVFNPYLDGIENIDITVSDWDDGNKICYEEYLQIDFTLKPVDLLYWMAATYQPY